jgi:hypothetical protein
MKFKHMVHLLIVQGMFYHVTNTKCILHAYRNVNLKCYKLAIRKITFEGLNIVIIKIFMV